MKTEAKEMFLNVAEYTVATLTGLAAIRQESALLGFICLYLLVDASLGGNISLTIIDSASQLFQKKP